MLPVGTTRDETLDSLRGSPSGKGNPASRRFMKQSDKVSDLVRSALLCIDRGNDASIPLGRIAAFDYAAKPSWDVRSTQDLLARFLDNGSQKRSERRTKERQYLPPGIHGAQW
jgi:hypothetical protein